MKSFKNLRVLTSFLGILILALVYRGSSFCFVFVFCFSSLLGWFDICLVGFGTHRLLMSLGLT